MQHKLSHEHSSSVSYCGFSFVLHKLWNHFLAEDKYIFFTSTSKAKLLLKKKRYQEQTLERTDNQLENLEKMVNVFIRT